MLTTLKRKTFSALEALCLAEGGDGDAALVHEKYKELANDFEEWLKENNNTWWTKSENEEYKQVTFHNNQECIYFTSRKPTHSISVIESLIIDV